jgi:hypothetical protein
MLEWVPGNKHADTHPTVFRNVWIMETLRRVLKSRCPFCDYPISDDDKQVKELVVRCERKDCPECTKTLSKTRHAVCTVCYDMWHALYMNYCMKSLNYFKYLDEEDERKRRDDDNNRKRMGL